MTLTATVYTFEIDLADNDRGVYETLALRVARHPSETEEYLWTRVLAYALEYREGIAFTAGLSTPDEPALWVKDLTGTLQAWIEVGTPDAARLHKATKAAPRVSVYIHRDPTQYLARLSGETVHRADTIALWSVDRSLLAGLVARLERRVACALSLTDRDVFLAIGNDTLSGPITPLSLVR